MARLNLVFMEVRDPINFFVHFFEMMYHLLLIKKIIIILNNSLKIWYNNEQVQKDKDHQMSLQCVYEIRRKSYQYNHRYGVR